MLKRRLNHVILVSGKARSGKNQFAEYLKENLEERNLVVATDLFARGVKDGCREDFSELVKYLNEHTNIKTQDYNWYENKTELTRILLQIYGTNIFRNRVDGDWWVKKQIERILRMDANVCIITDARFPNEIDLVKEKLGKLCTVFSIRINRHYQETGIPNHASEVALDNYLDFDYIYDNDGSLEQLNEFASIVVDDIS